MKMKFLFCVGLIFAFHMFNNKLLRDTSHRGHKSYGTQVIPQAMTFGPSDSSVYEDGLFMEGCYVRVLQVFIPDKIARFMENISQAIRFKSKRYCSILFKEGCYLIIQIFKYLSRYD